MAYSHSAKHRALHVKAAAKLEPGARLTEQHHADECDATKIIQKYARTGYLTHVNNIPGRYVDLPDSIDFQQAHETLTRAREAFATVPSQLRASYNNDPAAFLSALVDPSQKSLLTQHGIFNTQAATQTPTGQVSVESVPPPTPTSSP